ncbi:MAG: hypothetical protein AAFO78_03715 [Pseudomonadota bacterium]
MAAQKNSRILVIMTDSLASFVASEPIFEEIRNAHPEATISLLTTKALERLARSAPYFDQIAASPPLHDKATRQNLINQVRKTRFSKVFDLSGGEASRRLSTGLGWRKPKWVSMGGGRPDRSLRSGVDRLGDVAKFCAGGDLANPARYPSLGWSLDTRKDSANMQPSWYGLNSAYGLLLVSDDNRQRMAASQYAQLANLMSGAGIIPVLIGDTSLNDFGDDIAAEAPDLVDLTGKSDHLQLASLARNASFFVSDLADEMYLALSVGCDGVLVSPYEDQDLPISGRHVVRIAPAPGRAGDVDPHQIWQTVRNMGLHEKPFTGNAREHEDQARIRRYA